MSYVGLQRKLKNLTNKVAVLRTDVNKLKRGTGAGAAWSAITGKPSAYPPAAHVHAMNTVTGLDAALAAVNLRIDGNRAARHRAAIAIVNRLRASQHVGVLTLGDSKMEGQGVTGEGTVARSQNQMLAVLRAAANATGAGWDAGRGYIPAKYETFFVFPDAPVLTNAVGVNEGGLGGRSVSVELTGGTINFGNLDFGTASSFQVAFTWRPDTANVQVLIDDVVATTINTNNATLVYGGLTTVTLPSGGVHNIKIRQTGPYVARVEGIVHRTANKGITLYDGCRSGAQTTLYTPGSTNPDRIWQSMSTVCQNVAVIVCALGANDMASLTVSQWESNLRAIVTKGLQVFPTAGFVFLMGAERIEDANVPGSTTHAAFTAAARKVMAEFDHTTFIEEGTYWRPIAGGSASAQDPWGWLADTVHYGIGASKILGRALADAVLGPTGPTGL